MQDSMARKGTGNSDDTLLRYRPWFYAAALYNLVWGSVVILFPRSFWRLIRLPPPNHMALWQVTGMFVLVYAPGYWWTGRRPFQHRHLILIALLGKILGPAGFAWSVARGRLPLSFGLTLLTNDLLWWPAFVVLHARRDAGKRRLGQAPARRVTGKVHPLAGRPRAGRCDGAAGGGGPRGASSPREGHAPG